VLLGEKFIFKHISSCMRFFTVAEPLFVVSLDAIKKGSNYSNFAGEVGLAASELLIKAPSSASRLSSARGKVSNCIIFNYSSHYRARSTQRMCVARS
jgi:hypothetical protein